MRGMVSPHVFGPPALWPDQDLVALSAEIDADLVLAAYRTGVFPMPLMHSQFAERMGWWSPMVRGVLPLDALRVTRSLRQSSKRYRTSVDAAFGEVLARCADPSRPHGWIEPSIQEVFLELHRLGYAHSVECWTADGTLAGGLYGVGLGGLFAGESMFHDAGIGRDASKVALVRLVQLLGADGVERVVDVQWRTPHLASLGVIELDRAEYLDLLDEVLELPAPDWRSHA